MRTNQITLRLKGNTSDQDVFGQIVELEAQTNEEKKDKKEQYHLRIIEIEFLKTLTP